jgi:hypothetical protein
MALNFALLQTGFAQAGAPEPKVTRRFDDDRFDDHAEAKPLVTTDEWVGASLPETLASVAGDDWTPELAAQWTEAYGAIAQLMQTPSG